MSEGEFKRRILESLTPRKLTVNNVKIIPLKKRQEHIKNDYSHLFTLIDEARREFPTITADEFEEIRKTDKLNTLRIWYKVQQRKIEWFIKWFGDEKQK
jgi:hypothetical protein